MRTQRLRSLLSLVLVCGWGGCSLDFASLSSEADAGEVVERDSGPAIRDAAIDADTGPVSDGGADAGLARGRLLRETSGALSFAVTGATSLGAGALAVGRSPAGLPLADDGVVAYFGEAPWIARTGGLLADRLESVVTIGSIATAVGTTESASVGTNPNVDGLVVTVDETRVLSVQHWGTSTGLDERFHAVATHSGQLFMAGSISSAAGSNLDGLVVFGDERTALRVAFAQSAEFYAVAASTDTIYLAGERASSPTQGVVVAIERAAPHTLRWSRAIGGASDSSLSGLSADAAGVIAVGHQEGRAIRWTLAEADGSDRALRTVGSGVLTSIVSGPGFEYLLGVSSGSPVLYRLLSGEMYERSSWPGIGLAPDQPGAALVHTASGPGLLAVSTRERSDLHWLAPEGPCGMSSPLTLSVLGAGGSSAPPLVSTVTVLAVSLTDSVTEVTWISGDACP